MADRTENGNPADIGKDEGTGGRTFRDSLGSVFSQTPSVEPADIGKHGSGDSETGGSGTTQRRRGRPPGSKNKTGKTASPVRLDIAGVEQVLLSIHGMLALLTKAEEWEIDEKEAARMAAAFERVSQHYPALAKISPKTIDHMNFASVLGGVYGTRIIAMFAKKSAEKTQQNRPVRPAGPVSAAPVSPNNNVTPMRPANPTAPPQDGQFIPYGV